jgi:cytochrome oxidase assembly protein ShyY1
VVATAEPSPRTLGLTLTALPLIVTFALLGNWQSGRVYRPVDGYWAEPTTVPLNTVVQAGSQVPTGVVARQVVVSGSYHSTGQSVIGGQVVGGAPVSYVVDELLMSDRTAVLVLRGWVVNGELALAALPTGSVQVTGRIQSGSSWLGSMKAPTGYSLRSGYLVRTAQPPPDPLSLQPVPTDPPASHAETQFHLQNAIYVVQWYLLVGIVILAWWRLRRARFTVADEVTPLSRVGSE